MTCVEEVWKTEKDSMPYVKISKSLLNLQDLPLQFNVSISIVIYTFSVHSRIMEYENNVIPLNKLII